MVNGANVQSDGDLALDLRHVAKTYRGKIHALRGIDLRVHRGEVFGLLGPNGAGKSTLVKILMTVIRPTRCDGAMLGRPVGHKPTLAQIGYLPENHRFPQYLKAAQVLDYFGALGGVAGTVRRERAGELLELVGLSAWSDKPVRSFSKGMRQRLGIAQSLINDPELIFLDEPTDGVDPVGRRDIRQILTELRSRGKAVLLNSHILTELEQVCDRVAILVQGTVRSQGTIDELTENQRGYVFRVQGPAPDDAALLARRSIPGVERVSVERDRLFVGVEDPERIQPLVDALRARDVIIRSLAPHRPSLEDLFLQAVTDPATGAVLAPGASADPSRN